MGLEAATYISELVTSNPPSSDLQSQGDDHLRLIKAVLQATFPNATRAFRVPDTGAVKTGNYSVDAPEDDQLLILMDATGAARTVTLPTADLVDGLMLYIVKVDASVNTVTISASANINGASTLVLRHQWDCAIVTYNLTTNTWYANINFNRRFVAPSSKTADYTLTVLDHGGVIDMSASAANRVITLPNTLTAGFFCYVRKNDSTANTVTLDATSGGNINGAATAVLRYQYEMHKIIWDGTTWSLPVYDNIPPGSSMMWWTDTAPTGWSFLEGAAISRTGNPRLFALFSTLYGAGNGTTTFNLPDIRGRFLRVWDHAKGNDPDAASRTAPAGSTITAGDHVGTEQASALEDHRHNYERDAGSVQSGGGAGGGAAASTTTESGTVLSGGTTPAASSTETRAINVYVGIIMKLG